MRSAVPLAASPAPSSPASSFARRLRRLRVTLVVALAVAVPLIVALVSHQAAAARGDAYRDAARAEAEAVARQAAVAPRGGLDRIRSGDREIRGIAVYRPTRAGYRQVASSGAAGPAPTAASGTVERHAGGRHLLVLDAAGRGARVVRVTWDLARTDAAIAGAGGGFPLGLTLLVGAAALAAYALLSRFGLGRLSGLADELAEGQQSLAAMALEDPLTGLPNKRAFNDRLEAELGRAAREFYPVSVVAIDLDKFKQINDTWGHAVGDEALKKLARELQRQLRAGDLCGRLGGDEFMLALVRADAATAEHVLRRIYDALAPGRDRPRAPEAEHLGRYRRVPAPLHGHGADREPRGRRPLLGQGARAGQLAPLLRRGRRRAGRRAERRRRRPPPQHDEHAPADGARRRREEPLHGGPLGARVGVRGGAGQELPAAPGPDRADTRGRAPARRGQDRRPHPGPAQGGPAQPRRPGPARPPLRAGPRDDRRRRHARGGAHRLPRARALGRRRLSRTSSPARRFPWRAGSSPPRTRSTAPPGRPPTARFARCARRWPSSSSRLARSSIPTSAPAWSRWSAAASSRSPGTTSARGRSGSPARWRRADPFFRLPPAVRVAPDRLWPRQQGAVRWDFWTS